MNYLKFTLTTQDEHINEILIARLSNYEFNGFSEEETGLVAYIGEDDYTSSLQKVMEELKEQYQFTIQKDCIVDQNWNAKWEADYEPVLVDDFCAVRATFHQPIPTAQHEIIVTPKMSFGTGHHATTYMMMKQMENMDWAEKTVFDYGCGTGVLAILAQKLGAKNLDAVDIDDWAYENTLENISINNCSEAIKVFCGEIEVVPLKQYHVVLANINRNVILNTMDQMSQRLKEGGFLLTSGFLEEDIELVVEAAQQNGLQLTKTMRREKWRCLAFVK